MMLGLFGGIFSGFYGMFGMFGMGGMRGVDLYLFCLLRYFLR